MFFFFSHGVVIEAKYKPKSFCYNIQWISMLLLLLEVPCWFGVEWGLVHKEANGVNFVHLVSRLMLLSN